MLEQGNNILQQQPFSVLLGAKLTELSSGKVELRVTIRPEHLQQHGFVHGGVVSYCADNALTYAGGTALKQSVVTSEFKINYVRPVIGDMLIARAQAIHAGKKQAVCRCDVFVVKDSEEKLCAVAQGTITAVGSGN